MAGKNARTILGLKLIAGAILFLSAVSQNFLYADIDGRMREYADAGRDRSLIDKGALIHLTDYYILSNADLSGETPLRPALARYHLRQHALKLYQSEAVGVAVARSVSRKERQRYVNELGTILGSVSDYQSLAAFTDFANRNGGPLHEAAANEYGRLVRIKAIAKWAYLGFYALGGLILLSASYLEWRAAPK